MSKNTSNMIQSRKQESSAKVNAVLSVLDKYKRNKKRLDIRAIAAEANVSTKFLYTNPVVKEKIKELQGMPVNTSEENKDIIIKSLKKQLEACQKKIEDLTNQLAGEDGTSYKELYEQERSKCKALEQKLMDRFDPFTGLPKAG